MYATLLLSCALISAAPTTKTVPNCLVTLIHEAQVPAKEPGVLTDVFVKEGQVVQAGEPLAKIDDIEVQAAQRVAEFKLKQSDKEAKSDVTVRFSKASSDVARANYEAAQEACRRQPNTFSATEMREKWLVCVRSELEIEKSKLDLELLGIKAQVSQAELDVAKENVERRTLRAPLDGHVEKVRRHVGEWVQPGDPVIHVVRLNELRVEALLKSVEVFPGAVMGRPVTVTVELENRRTESFTGKVVHVSKENQAGGVYGVWAEVQNRQQNGEWLLRPGTEAEMTIQLR